MSLSRWIRGNVVVILLLSAPGCASIVSGRHADVTFQSNVPQALVVVKDRRGEEVATAQSGSTVALPRKNGLVLPAKYTATFAAPGYHPAAETFGSTINPWILGNAIFGGVAGLAIDSMTGASWSPKKSTVYAELMPLHPSIGPQSAPAMQGPHFFNSETASNAPQSPVFTAPGQPAHGAVAPVALGVPADPNPARL
jgi:hypothetical protein